MKNAFITAAFQLLKNNPAFRAVVYARSLSILALGLLTVAIPVQIQWMTGSVMLVGLAVTLAGGGMFTGLLLGGVLADRYDRRTMILLGRTTCGVGFVGLAINAMLPTPSLLVIYALGIWDGFFGAMSVTALLAATPALVGRENIATAGVINMMTFRLGTILAPTLGGWLIASGGVVLNFVLAAAGTFLTLWPLRTLPAMRCTAQGGEHPALALWRSVQFVLRQRLLWSVMLVGGLVSAIAAVRVLFPALAIEWRVDVQHLGMLYSAVPLGAVVGMLTSHHWSSQTPDASGQRHIQALFISAFGAFAAIIAMGLTGHFVIALLCLAVYGYFSAINNVLQFVVVQHHTPDNLLGRVNGIWMAQNVGSDMFGALLVGMMGAWLLPTGIAVSYGVGALVVGGVVVLLVRQHDAKATPGSPLAKTEE